MRRWVRLIIVEGDDNWVRSVQEKSWMPPECLGHELINGRRMIHITLNDELFDGGAENE